jgi:molecular chaperone DnaK
MTLGRFELVGIPPAPRGVPQIEVTFAIDTDGVVNVSARDLGTGKSQSIAVTASSGLSEQDVERLVSEAESSKEADAVRRRLIELRNKGDGLVYSTERTLEEFAESIDPSDRKNVEAAVAKARDAMRSEDVDAIRNAVDELSGLTYQMTERLYAVLGGDSG